MSANLQSSAPTVLACPECDALVSVPALGPRQQARCPRCRAVIANGHRNSIDTALAASFAGLLFYVPAVTMPVLQLEMLGREGHNSLIGGVSSLWGEDFRLLALLVLLCSVVAPLLQLLLNFVLSLCQRWNRYPDRFPDMLKWAQFIQKWSMLEVYMLGILVAYVKMMEDADEVMVDVGVYCLVGVLLSILVCIQSFDGDAAWHRWEASRS